MNECQDFFEGLEAQCTEVKTAAIRGGKLREIGCERYQRLFEWEMQTASRHSPGPVESFEQLRKALFEGRDVVAGTLARQAFHSLEDLGLSGDRTRYCDASVSQDRFESMTVPGEKTLYGYVDLSVSHMRDIKCTNDAGQMLRAIAVYDTADQDNPAHCEAFLTIRFSRSKPMKTIQQDLRDYYQEHIKRYPARNFSEIKGAKK